VIAPSLLLVLGIAASEFLLHYHIDWLKTQITYRNGWTATRARPEAGRLEQGRNLAIGEFQPVREQADDQLVKH
jgi:hypothetical protein